MPWRSFVRGLLIGLALAAGRVGAGDPPPAEPATLPAARLVPAGSKHLQTPRHVPPAAPWVTPPRTTQPVEMPPETTAEETESAGTTPENINPNMIGDG